MGKEKKKILFIIAVNILLFVILFFACEFLTYYIYNKKYSSGGFNSIPFKYNLNLQQSALEQKEKWFRKFARKPDGINYNSNHAIVIFGCSFAYGDNLKTEQTLSYKLAKTLKIPVYNQAFPGGGLAELWYQTGAEGRKKFYNSISSKSDTFIYVMINEHYNRLYNYFIIPFLRQYLNYYYDKEIKSKLQKNFREDVLKISYIYRHFDNYFIQKFFNDSINKKEILNNATLHLIESKIALEKNLNKKVNFIVILYDDILFENDFIEILKKENIKVIKTKDLTKEDLKSPKYTLSETDKHPNEAAWDLLTPLIAKEIKKIWKENEEKAKK